MAGRLYDRLTDRYGDTNVFMDVDSIEPGLDFKEVIERAIGQCAILIALIGREWLSGTDQHGKRRLNDPDDMVSMEIKFALTCGIRVIPVLVDGAGAPRREQLPPALSSLARRNAVRLDHETFRNDVRPLIDVLDQAITTDELDETIRPADSSDSDLTATPDRALEETTTASATNIAPDVTNGTATVVAGHSDGQPRPRAERQDLASPEAEAEAESQDHTSHDALNIRGASRPRHKQSIPRPAIITASVGVAAAAIALTIWLIASPSLTRTPDSTVTPTPTANSSVSPTPASPVQQTLSPDDVCLSPTERELYETLKKEDPAAAERFLRQQSADIAAMRACAAEKIIENMR